MSKIDQQYVVCVHKEGGKGDITFEYVTSHHEAKINNISMVFFFYYINLIDTLAHCKTDSSTVYLM